MQVLSKNQRKCPNCGAVTNYSKHDIKRMDEESPLCAKCARGEKKVSKFKPSNPFGSISNDNTPEEEETETREPDPVPVLRESVSSRKGRKDSN